MKRHPALALVLVLVALAGCQSDPSWRIGVHDLTVTEEGDGEYNVSGAANLGGAYHDVVAEDVRLRLLTADDRPIDEISIGTLDGDAGPRSVSFNESVDTSPQCVLLAYDEIEGTEGYTGIVKGYALLDGDWGFDSPVEDPFETCEEVMAEAEQVTTGP